MRRRDPGDDGSAGEVGARVDQKVVGETEDATVAREGERRGVKLVARVSRAEEARRSGIGPADRPAEPPRQRGDDQLFRVHGALRAKAPTHVGRGDPDGLRDQPERFSDALPHAVRHLGARPHVQAGRRPVPSRGGSPRLERQRGEAGAAHAPGHHDRGPPERRLEISHLEGQGRRHVRPPVGVNELRPGLERRLGIDGRQQRLVLHADGHGAVRRRVGIGGDDDGDRLAREPDDAVGERRLAIRLHSDSGDDRRRQRAAQLGEICEAEDAEHAGLSARRPGVDADDPCVSMRAPHDGDVRRVLEWQVADIAAAAGEESQVLTASGGLADHAHDGLRSPSSAARESRIRSTVVRRVGVGRADDAIRRAIRGMRTFRAELRGRWPRRPAARAGAPERHHALDAELRPRRILVTASRTGHGRRHECRPRASVFQ